MPAKKKEPAPTYAAVCLNWKGDRIYTSFSNDAQLLINLAETIGHGVIAIEEAHAGKPPVWKREE